MFPKIKADLVRKMFKKADLVKKIRKADLVNKMFRKADLVSVVEHKPGLRSFVMEPSTPPTPPLLFSNVR